MNEKDLLKKHYFEIFSEKENRPYWAVKKKNNEEIVNPSIPFVGNDYNETRILLYGSTENLAKYNGHLDNNEIAHNRHRLWFDKNSNGRFFPNVHIAPIDNGPLVNIMAYVAMKTVQDINLESPKQFLEKVAFGNFGKFSIEVMNGETNMDYAGDYNKLAKSIEYIKADLTVLKPKIVIIPNSIFNHSKVRNLFKKQFPEIQIIPIYQIQQNNINNKDRLQKFKHKDKNELGVLVEWQNHFGGSLKGKTNQNFYSFYSYLDDKLKN